ncbi:hypothetical protein BCR35DRAFT_303100 [Leucosporidium creatinivorum]|uniref:F-box domain-containing protein n=1 Tax=Leucosporidium creatinivorum TaxID=106004 RepID=A0A1Y2FL61_9BASI|nr:hypothetical protein BCR35DRAFT_303100 [Leucosporidium creatinivorum]
MAGSRRKSAKSTVSYQEVDSDIDMQDEDKELEASRAPRASKKARKTGKKAKGNGTGSFSLEIFLNMPLDLLAETCAHLDPRDLVKLARTSKLFRSLLLSRSSRSIWASARRAAGLPDIEDLSEINYALWLYGTTCMECGSPRKSVKLDYVLMTRHCNPCRKLLLTPKQGITRLGLHPHTLACVSKTTLGPAGDFWKAYFLTSELMEVNSTLFELQDEDEIAQDAWSSSRLATGSRTRKPKGVSAVEAPESALDAFVARKSAEVSRRKKQGEAIALAMQLNDDEERQRFESERNAAWNALKLHLEVTEWLEDDINWYKRNVFDPLYWSQTRHPVSREYRPLARPVASFPSTDAEGWAAIKDQVERFREKEEAIHRARRARQLAEQHERLQSDRLRNHYYDRLRGQQKGDDFTTFPCLHPFKMLASVQPLWTNGATLDQATWDNALDAIKQDVEAYRIATRVKAITVILAANNDVPISTLSTDPADYSEDEYGSEFFSKLTSYFYSTRDGAKPYPECLTFDQFGFWNATQPVRLHFFLTRHHILIMQAILRAGELDEDTATMQDVVALGKTLRWAEHPHPLRARETWTPLELVLSRAKSFTDLVFTRVLEDITLDSDWSVDGYP